MNAISFEHVTKRYADGTVAVRDLSLQVPAGQTTMLVGPSGCGKTTTLRMINRMIDPTSGTITIDGKPNTSFPKTKLRRSIGYVIQNAGLFPHRTVLQNIMTVPLLNGQNRKDASAKAQQMMELVGLDRELGSRYPAQLSGGQQQRVGVARALAGEPAIMLMDEPFSALDPVVRDDLQGEFRRLARQFAVTVVFVTHDIDEAIKIGDHIAVFESGGTIAQLATPTDLLRHPLTEHVAEFVGRDRGFRALSFIPFTVPSSLPPLPFAPTRKDTFTPRATTISPGQSMRDALDAVLTSPNGEATLLDQLGNPEGMITLDHLIEAGLLSSSQRE